MNTFIGTKVVQAKPMTRKEYNDFINWTLPSDENGDDEGFLIEDIYSQKANTKEYGRYVSWSPKDIFERAYKKTSSMSFGDAVSFLKKGKKVARKGWNGKGMYVCYMKGYPEGIEVNEITQKSHNLPAGTKLKYREYLQLYTAQKDVAMWSPSTSDALADDWMLID